MVPWIKMRVNLLDDPRVVIIADALNTHAAVVVGMLYVLWVLGDQHTTDGLLKGYTPEMLDGRVGTPGFARACSHPDVGWLEIGETPGQRYLRIVDFQIHNGESAKLRTRSTERKRLSRAAVTERSRIPAAVRRAVIERDGEQCAYCGRKHNQKAHPTESESDAYVSFDHVVPSTRGGGNDPENIVSACLKCNRKKGDRTPNEAGMPILFGQFASLSHTFVPPEVRQDADQRKRKRKNKSNTSSLSTEKKGGAAGAAVLWADWQKHLPGEMQGDDVHDACKRWTRHRTEIRKPLKPTMLQAQAKLLTAWGTVRAIAAIDHTIAMGWTGLREPEATRPANGHPANKTPAERRREEQDRAIEEIGR